MVVVGVVGVVRAVVHGVGCAVGVLEEQPSTLYAQSHTISN